MSAFASRRSSARFALAALLAPLACTGDSLTGSRRVVPSLGDRVLLACSADVVRSTVSCAPASAGVSAAPSATGRSDLILGGQNQFVKLTSSAVNYDAPTSIFSFNVTVQNLIPQSLGTTDGTTLDPNGVRVFFNSGPTVTGGTGAIAVANPDDVATFTASGQPYYQYNQILASNTTSAAKSWQLSMPPTVTSFAFTLLVSAEVQFPDGYIDVAPSSAVLPVGSTVQLAATVRDVVGRDVSAGRTLDWQSSAPAIASVSPSGLVTGAGHGTATITVTDDLGGGHTRIGTSAIVVNDAPGATSDSYAAKGNATLSIAAPGVLANDLDANSDPLTASPGTFASANGGTVTLAADGSFTYLNAAGFAGSSDSFSYTTSDGFTTASATVTIGIASRVWYVRGDATAPGDGRDASPYPGLAAAVSAAAAGDSILLVSSGTAIAAGVTLKNDQSVLGQAAGDVTTFMNGSTVVLLANGAAGTVTRSTAGAAITLAGNNTVRGIALTASNGAAISGASFGTLSLNQLTLAATGGPALSLNTGTVNGTIASATSTSSSSSGISVVGVAGSLTFGAGSITSAGSASIAVSGGSVSFTWPGAFSKSNAAPLVSVTGGHTGTLAFAGTLSATNGTGLQFDNADGSYTFGTVTLGGGDAGIDVLNGSSGTFSFASPSTIVSPTGTALTVNASAPASFSYAGSITQGSAARLVSIDGSTGACGTITLSGTLTASASSTGLLVQNCASGAVTFSGGTKTFSTGANRAVTLASNGAASIAFTNGGLAVTTTTANGFDATGGGTVTVTTGSSANTLASTTGTALNVQSTTIGAAGITFRSIAASGGANGIALASTGTSGGLTVTGDGATTGSGGTIANSSGADGATSGNGIYLSSTRNVSLAFMGLSGHSNNGLFGQAVRNFSLNRMTFTGSNGTSNSGTYNESSVNLSDLGGVVSITNSRLDGGAYNALRIDNTSGTAPAITALTIAYDTVTTMQGSTSDVRSTALLVNLSDGTVAANIHHNQVTAWWGNAIHLLAQGTASGTATIHDNFADNTNGALAAAGGIWVAGGNLAYNISSNVVRHTNGTAISADRAATGTNMNGTIAGNTIGVSGDANSGTFTGVAIFASHHGPGTTTVAIVNNVLRQINGSASGAITTITGDAAGSGGSGTMNATISGNNIQESGTTVNAAQWGILITHGVTSSAPGDTDAGCYDIRTNTIANLNMTTPGRQNAIRVNQRFGTTTRWPGYTLSAVGASSTTDMGTYLTSRNTISNTLNANSSTGGFLNTSPPGSTCAQPSM